MRLFIVAAIANVYCASGACTHQKWNMPSQTMGGSGTMVINSAGGKAGNMTIPPSNNSVQMDMFQSFDYETMSMVMRQSQNMTQGSFHSQTETGTILNWKAGLMTYSMKMRMDKHVQNSCKTIKLPFFLRFLPIGKIMEKIKDMEAGFFKCVDHRAGIDEFAANMEFPPSWVPKIMTPKMPRVNLTMYMDVDSAGLIKAYQLFEAMRMKVHININGKEIGSYDSKSQVQQAMAFSENRAGGPSEEDLKVPAEWGDCSKVHMPELEDLLAEWERADSPFLGHTRIIPHTLRAIMAEAKSSTVVV